MQSFTLALLCAVLFAACPRVTTLGVVTATRGLGTECDNAAQCISAACQQGVCCERVCGAQESCTLAGSQGRCVARTGGSECGQDADCPLSTPVCDPTDKVCCNTVCDGPCRSCTLAENPGECLVAPDNTDPRNACTGDCRACVAGQCAPAFPGSDPHDTCPAGMTCDGLGQCLAAGGEACSSSEDCATGSCIVGLCLRVDMTPVDSPSIPASDQNRGVPSGLQADALGGLVMSSMSQRLRVDPQDGDYWSVASRSQWAVTRQDGVWNAQVIEGCPNPGDLAAAAKVGVVGMVFLARELGPFGICLGRENEHTLSVSVLSPDGNVLRTEVIHTFHEDSVVQSLEAASSWDGQVAAVLGLGGQFQPQETRLITRNTEAGAWTVSPDLGMVGYSSVGTLVFLDGVPVLIGAFENPGQLRALQMEHPITRQDAVPLDAECATVVSIKAAVASVEQGPVAYVGFVCESITRAELPMRFAEYRPRNPAGMRWSTPREVALGGLLESRARDVSVVALSDGKPALIYLSGRQRSQLNVVRSSGAGWNATTLLDGPSLAASWLDSLTAVTVGDSIHIVLRAQVGTVGDVSQDYTGRALMLTVHP